MKYILSPVEMAIAQKLDIELFIDDFLEKLPPLSYVQRKAIVDSILQTGWEFFADELDEYFSISNDYEVLLNGKIKLLNN